MNIGDKVRLLRGTEEGVVVKIVNDSTVEIEIEDGFSFPVLRSEVVVVNKTEAEHFFKDQPSSGKPADSKSVVRDTTVLAQTGIFLGFELSGDLYNVWLCNNTDYTLAFKIDDLLHGTSMGVATGVLNPKSAQQVTSKSSKTFDAWADLLFSCLFFKKGIYQPKPLFTKLIQFKATSFTSRKGSIPLVDRDGYLYQLDSEKSPAVQPKSPAANEQVSTVDAQELREKMLSPKSPAQGRPTGPSQHRTIDLHLDKLLRPEESVPAEQALGYQLSIFEKELDTAIATGLDEITFVHGIGNGVLREEIHKRLSKMKNILYFQDAHKERFGYGATLIKIRS